MQMEAGSDEELVAVTTEAQREKFAAELAEAEDWLYGDGEAVDGTEYRARLRVLRTTGDPMELRAAERAARPKVRAGRLAGGARYGAGSDAPLSTAPQSSVLPPCPPCTAPLLPHSRHAAHAPQPALTPALGACRWSSWPRPSWR